MGDSKIVWVGVTVTWLCWLFVVACVIALLYLVVMIILLPLILWIGDDL